VEFFNLFWNQQSETTYTMLQKFQNVCRQCHSNGCTCILNKF